MSSTSVHWVPTPRPPVHRGKPRTVSDPVFGFFRTPTRISPDPRGSSQTDGVLVCLVSKTAGQKGTKTAIGTKTAYSYRGRAKRLVKKRDQGNDRVDVSGS